MILAVQPHFMERVVFEAVRRDADLESHYQRGFARCYDERDPVARDRAFNALHDEWFRELGLKGRILQMVREQQHFATHVNRLAVTHASSPNSHAVELFGAPGRYTVAVALTPTLLLDEPAFAYWIRHEFMHVDDMLNPAFGYRREGLTQKSTVAARNLLQDRYAVLWAMSIDARLADRGKLPETVPPRRLREFARAFCIGEAMDAGSRFELVWSACKVLPNHTALLEWALEGPPGITWHGERPDFRIGTQCAAGTACPLCGFPTFVWGTSLDAFEVAEAVSRDFPSWSPSSGLCARCVEVYRGQSCPI